MTLAAGPSPEASGIRGFFGSSNYELETGLAIEMQPRTDTLHELFFLDLSSTLLFPVGLVWL